jgi:hypothetical protein
LKDARLAEEIEDRLRKPCCGTVRQTQGRGGYRDELEKPPHHEQLTFKVFTAVRNNPFGISERLEPNAEGEMRERRASR